ncbi:TraR/DksA C4-type zinc finger protein [Paenibacillus agricola]|uniref:Molecular chaperone DnaK n=1 Tax=Paenibacillus agricola TaxID=2716264 RepID=A0ABX0J166_9BACL|nr:TraR/DksA C4-type zinc finger protein [Paenibacillus agricola]NHN28632.1 molecular chaperone DnaK [Paenibacillus agricola]
MNPHSASLNPQQIQSLQSILLDEKQWLDAHLEANGHFGLSESLRDQTGELSTNDNHPADLGSELFERSKDIALNENHEHHFEEVTKALERLENGQYGLCAVCGVAIPYERLQAVPTTLYCKEHVRGHSSNDRPVEEQLLDPPFGRTSFDGKTKETEFDGEDAWQIVESWGTSNSPAMAENPNVSNSYDNIEIEADEQVGYVEAFESFLATDMYGRHVQVVKNQAYHDYIHSNEGDNFLELDPEFDENDYTEMT